jgi:hypothetical protein
VNATTRFSGRGKGRRTKDPWRRVCSEELPAVHYRALNRRNRETPDPEDGYKCGMLIFTNNFAPTLSSTAEEKDQFYDALDPLVRTILNKEALFIMGDFNARVGADLEAWPPVIGHRGVGKMNENGQRLLELCSFNNQVVTNIFQHKDRYKESWWHPRSKH